MRVTAESDRRLSFWDRPPHRHSLTPENCRTRFQQSSLPKTHGLLSASPRLLLRRCSHPTFQTAPPLSPSQAHPIFASTMWMLSHSLYPTSFPQDTTHPALFWSTKGHLVCL